MGASSVTGVGEGSVGKILSPIINGQVQMNNLVKYSVSQEKIAPDDDLITTSVLGDDFDIVVDEEDSSDVWVDVGDLDIQLPTAGKYMITYTLNSRLRVGNAVDTIFLSAKVVKRTDVGEEEVNTDIDNSMSVIHYLNSPFISCIRIGN